MEFKDTISKHQLLTYKLGKYLSPDYPLCNRILAKYVISILHPETLIISKYLCIYLDGIVNKTLDLRISPIAYDALENIVSKNVEIFDKIIDQFEYHFIISDSEKSFRKISESLSRIEKIMSDEHARMLVMRSMT